VGIKTYEIDLSVRTNELTDWYFVVYHTPFSEGNALVGIDQSCRSDFRKMADALSKVKEEVAKRLKEDKGWPVKPDDVLVRHFSIFVEGDINLFEKEDLFFSFR